MHKVGTYLESPWKSVNFKIKIQGLESLWNLQSVLESPWISVLTLFWTQQRPKDLKDNYIAHVLEEVKKTQGPFLHWMESLKNEKCVLESPWIFVQKRVQSTLSKTDTFGTGTKCPS